MLSNTTTCKNTSSLKMLMAKLKDVQSTFNDIWRYVQEFKEDASASQVEVRLQTIDELWQNFRGILTEILCHEDFVEDDDAYEKDRLEFSNRYYQAKSFLMDKFKRRMERDQLDQSRRSDTTLHATADNVRLPQITLQTFSGVIDEWLSFRDLFTSLIHCKTDLPAVEKFHYLKGCLQGEPRNLIDPLPITESNYRIAWEMLMTRYNDSKQLKKRQIQSLFDLPTLSRESLPDLHNLLEGFERTVSILDQIVDPSDYKDLLLIHILATRLDPNTRRAWEEFSSTSAKDSLEDLTKFLQRRIRVLESLPAHSTAIPQRSKFSTVKGSFGSFQAIKGRCFACSADHLLYQCSVFQGMSVADRDLLLRKHSLCRNCFRRGHQAKECYSNFSCRNCKGRHHTLVCFKAEGEISPRVMPASTSSVSNDPRGSKTPESGQDTTNHQVSCTAQQFTSQVLLATAVVIVEDDFGNRYPARALLDSGSESNFITERLSQSLKVTREKVDIAITGIGQTSSRVQQGIKAVVRSRVANFSRSMKFLVLSKVIANLPVSTVNIDGWNIPAGIQLADPAFYVSKEVDMVLGIEAFFEFFETRRRIFLGERMPFLEDSVFGWVVCGGQSITDKSTETTCNISTSERLADVIAKFWSCEEVDSVSCYSPEEAWCESHFSNTVRRESSGRYTVALPIKEDCVNKLGNSREMAQRRLLGIEKRFARDERLREQYVLFMEEYLQLGHMRRIIGDDQYSAARCYLPHHPVVKEASTTTKVRVVFDASCKTTSGIALNDALLAGPVIQEDLRSIILRCRTKQIMLVADVEKMFRQIHVRPEDRHYQSILWRSFPNQVVETFELNTVTYGTKPAPFLATRTLKQLAMDEGQSLPLAAKAVEEDTYMDDVITGANSKNEVLNLRTQLDELMERGGFKLRKWASNCSEILDGIPEENLAIRDSPGINLNPDSMVKTLGLNWLPKTDEFKVLFHVSPLMRIKPLTKRQVLSIIATLFDPLGLIGPVITTAKVIMQQIWTLRSNGDQRFDWDQPLPLTVGEKWYKFHEQLSGLSAIRVERCVITPEAVSVQLHCFSDASEKAYGGCIYVRSDNAEGMVTVRLLTSKAKVSPLKCQSIPRLELCGALLTAQLFEKAVRAIRLDIPTYFWTDSTCVLRWIQAVPTTWTTFVANRVAKIQNITNGYEWRHVSGIQNPADLISRGIFPNDIHGNEFWWNGPRWLAETSLKWPSSTDNTQPEQVERERRSTIVTSSAANSAMFDFNEWYLSKFGSYSDLVRRTAIWLRFMGYLTKSSDKQTGFITTPELRKAEGILVRSVQKESFSEEWNALQKGDTVSRRSPLRWFNPYIGSDQIMRVGGRLKNSEEPEEAKHPMVLPARHRFTRMLFQYYHERLLHAGPQLLLSVVRLRFWPLGGRSVARHLVHQCHRCFRSKPSLAQQFMGDLPAARVTVSRPFTKTGIDYFGPVYIKPGPRRTAVNVSLFVCLCTKAVHLELVGDLSTEKFLQALRRFIARRGKCTDIYSDNGTNFVGARNKLKEFMLLLRDKQHNDEVSKMCTNDDIQWHFNPPSAPHFGGLWEAAVRSAKHHILRAIGETPVSSEDMTTLLAQVEACLNSRPLTPMSNDPTDLQPLTPAHFLIGSSLLALPEPDLSMIPINRLHQWRLIQQRLQNFWKRWQREYLCQLQGRMKRWKPPIPIQIGKLVIIKDDNLPPTQWKMGRIEEVHPGTDGIVRVVTLKTATGSLKRPVEKICFLPENDDQGN